MMIEKKERPQERWSKKHGYISKSFKMYKSVADDFRDACNQANRPQASVIQELMLEYIRQSKNVTKSDECVASE